MGRACTVAVVAVLLVNSVGCIRPQANYADIDAVIEPRDVTAPFELTGCDAKSFPVRCKRVAIHYRKGSERLIVTKATAK